jgi:membrane-associated phospholipid phosphatase
VTTGSDPPTAAAPIPRPVSALAVLSVAAVVIALSAWLATAENAERAQTGLVRWFNDPPQPVAAVFAVVNPLCRPIPLTLLSVAYVGWVLLTAGRASMRLEIVRALVLSLALTELMARVMKDLANQPRPMAVIRGLDTHGYPVEPLGNAYPSAHTALFVGAACALWPWMRWPQRIVAVAIAVLVGCNRIYIGAHWSHARAHKTSLRSRARPGKRTTRPDGGCFLPRDGAR